MHLTWVDRQFSPDALAEAVGLRTAFRIGTARLRSYSATHSRILPIRLAAGNGTGISIADVCLPCCWKHAVMDEFKRCHSCSADLVTNEVGAVYITPKPTLHTSGNHCYFRPRIPHFLCGSCHNQFFAQAFTCPHCNEPTTSESEFIIFLGRHSSLVPSHEIILREVFLDEIGECEGSSNSLLSQ